MVSRRRPAIIRLLGRTSVPLEPTLCEVLYSFRQSAHSDDPKVAVRLRRIQAAAGVRTEDDVDALQMLALDILRVGWTTMTSNGNAESWKGPSLITSSEAYVLNSELPEEPRGRGFGPVSPVRSFVDDFFVSESPERTSDRQGVASERVVAPSDSALPAPVPVRPIDPVLKLSLCEDLPPTPPPSPSPVTQATANVAIDIKSPATLTVPDSSLVSLSPRQREECDMVKDYMERRINGASWESTTNQGLDPIEVDDWEMPLRTEFTSYLCEQAINQICAQHLDMARPFRDMPTVVENDKCPTTGGVKVVEEGTLPHRSPPHSLTAQDRLQRLRQVLNEKRKSDEVPVLTVPELKALALVEKAKRTEKAVQHVSSTDGVADAEKCEAR
ncbi:uncharacterized protein BXZ73DRAFT_76500 [Epithele typhae]|uniref:uncharacterized protein n=1 Tax=Epithele typhae TaxID=378194 RepID=UPI00200784AA|nr:uncharacterized protein BXZ73DRAFT_76500 [Epithele typhae]KAH9937872.1 hypothetical protein BXZ73DRAFT_76500 [Epithele typhae]